MLLDRGLFNLIKERFLFIARFSEIDNRTIPVAKTRKHTAYDHDFQEIPMNFMKHKRISANFRKCIQLPESLQNWAFSGQSEKTLILHSGLKVLAVMTSYPYAFPLDYNFVSD